MEQPAAVNAERLGHRNLHTLDVLTIPNRLDERVADVADAFWAATITSRFTHEMIHAIVATGRLSNRGIWRTRSYAGATRSSHTGLPDQPARSVRGDAGERDFIP